MAESVVSRCCYYKIPRKKKYCVIVYNGKIFQSFEDLQQHLQEVDHFSDTVAAMVLDTVAKYQVEKAAMASTLRDIGIKKKLVDKYLSGVMVK